jgi:hypothetical protein
MTPFRGTNHETQQSPLYYWVMGLLLRVAPPRNPESELYLLRFINATFAFCVGVLIWKSRRHLSLAWVPVAVLALVPGFGIAMSRVANDALCTLLVSIAVAGSMASGTGGWLASAGSLAAGIAPWAKLYGLAAGPVSAVREIFREAVGVRIRMLRLLLAALPPVVLALCSWRLTGHLFPVMYNVRNEPFASVFEVPWLQDAWLVMKSHIWMSGMSFLVFPTWFYVAPVALMAWGFVLTVMRSDAGDRQSQRILLGFIGVFVLALAYHDWRSFSSYKGPGGTGGWYLWAVAFPELLLLTDGAVRRAMLREWILPTLTVFIVLTILADTSLLLESTGKLVKTPKGHIVGLVAGVSTGEVATAYLESRPRAIAVAGVILCASSWLLATYVAFESYRQTRRSAECER